jgi:hypothetical protein
MSIQTFTREYLHSEMVEFRKRMGDRTFWQGDRPGNTIYALLYVYVNTTDVTDADKSLIKAITEEYDMRLSMCIANGIYQPPNI